MDTPSSVLIWIEDYVRALAGKASAEILTQHTAGLEPQQLEMRLLFLAQMVASNTDTNERREWSMALIKDMARHDGVDLDQ